MEMWLNFIYGWALLADGLARMVSLGRWRPSLGAAFILWRFRRHAAAQMQAEEADAIRAFWEWHS